MCGRFTLRTPNQIIVEDFMLTAAPPQRLLRFNITPTQDVAVVREIGQDRVLSAMRWGLVPFWADDPSIGARMINARGETVAEKSSFRAAYKSRRCLIPTDGYYEWTKVPTGKQPYYFHMPDERPFAFAGLWESWDKGGLGPLETCTIITTSSNEQLREFHDRMPVILAQEHYSRWLSNEPVKPGEVDDLLVPLADGVIQVDRVSTRVNSVKNDDDSCIVPIPTQRRDLFS
jgi:putative SOS response-associated peptidase YedK